MDDFKVLFLQLRDYLRLQKENAAMGAAEGLTVVLSAVAIGFVIINVALAVLLLLGVVFWLKRRDWITNPIARLMVMVFMSDGDKKEDGV